MRSSALLATFLTVCTLAAKDRSPHQSKFVSANGIRLNYLDWGGSGPVLVFLPGMGDSAHTFDEFAPRFRQGWHVLGLSWRGTGLSDAPETGYDVETLTADLKGFLDALNIRRAILAGHSMAGGEMTRFAGLYPERVRKLVYLDAAYDRTELGELIGEDPVPHNPKPPAPPPSALVSAGAYIHYLLKQNPRAPGPRSREVWETELFQNSIRIRPDGSVELRSRDRMFEELRAGMASEPPDYSRVHAPALAIYAVQDHYNFGLPASANPEVKAAAAAYWRDTVLPWVRENIRKFEKGVRKSAVVELRNAHHLCYADRPDEVYAAMIRFLRQ